MSGTARSVIPVAARKESRCGAGRASMPDRIGKTIWCRPAYGRCCSLSTPTVVSTRIPAAAASAPASASSADLPTPASPCRTRTPPCSTTPSIRVARRCFSGSLPTKEPAAMLISIPANRSEANPNQRWNRRGQFYDQWVAQEASALGDYLRARREQIRPEDVGLSAGTRRRVAGLRREELATLAGISSAYYLRLEQGRVT